MTPTPAAPPEGETDRAVAERIATGLLTAGWQPSAFNRDWLVASVASALAAVRAEAREEIERLKAELTSTISLGHDCLTRAEAAESALAKLRTAGTLLSETDGKDGPLQAMHETLTIALDILPTDGPRGYTHFASLFHRALAVPPDQIWTWTGWMQGVLECGGVERETFKDINRRARALRQP